MARRTDKPDGDPLGRDRFQSPGGLWRVSSATLISLDDPVRDGQGTTSVRRVLAAALSEYSPETGIILLKAAICAASEIRRSEEQKSQDPRVQDVQKELRGVRNKVRVSARKGPRDPARVAWRRIAQRTGVDERQLLDAVRAELEELPTEPRRVDPTPMRALDILASAYIDTTGESPTRYQRRSDTPSRFFRLVEATYRVAGFHRDVETIDHHIRQYLDRVSA